MKTLLSVIALTGFISSASAAKDGWLDDIEKAKEQAKQGGNRILLDFTGSDWCGWCKKLDAEVFSQQEFKDYAVKRLARCSSRWTSRKASSSRMPRKSGTTPSPRGIMSKAIRRSSSRRRVAQKNGPAWLHGGRPEGVHQDPRKGKV